MKKSLYAIIVIILTLFRANAMAAKFDLNVERVANESQDNTGNDNAGNDNRVTREK